MRRALLLAAASLGLTAGSVWRPARVPAQEPDILGCEAACEVAAGGWPVPFVIDSPAISPVGSVSLSGALLGEDQVRAGALAASWMAWLLACGLAAWMGHRGLRRAPMRVRARNRRI